MLEARNFVSPFDQINYRHTDAFLSTSLPLGTLLQEAVDYLPRNEWQKPFEPTIFHPAFILQAVVNSKDAGLLRSPESLVKKAVDVAFVLHSNAPEAADQVEALRVLIADTGNADFLNHKQYKRINIHDWQFVQPKDIQALVPKLARIGKSSECLMISLGNSAYFAGIDLCARAQAKVGRDFVTFYPVKFSTESARDAQPYLTPKEAGLLIEEARGKKIVIHDTITARGKTTDQAQHFFRLLLGQTPTVMVHHDGRGIDRYFRNDALKLGRTLEDLMSDSMWRNALKDIDNDWTRDFYPEQLVQDSFLSSL